MLRGILFLLTIVSGVLCYLAEKQIHNEENKSVRYFVEIRDACGIMFFGFLLMTILTGL